LYRRIRAAQGQGRLLDLGLRRSLEHSLGADLSGVRLHNGPEADVITRLLDAPAATTGCDIFLAADCYRPGSSAGLRLLAHEAAHTVQQAQGVGRVSSSLVIGGANSCWERAAELAAARALLGGPAPEVSLTTPAPSRSAGLFVQCFNSWEHLLLGNATTSTLVTIARRSQGWQGLMRSWWNLMALWKDDPDSVTEQQIHALFPALTVLRLDESGCLVTFGELNALSDYVADASAMNSLPRAIILPLLQQIRQRCYNQLGALLGDSTLYRFAHAAAEDPGNGELGALEELEDLDRFTAPLGINHLKGLLARNACHFVPFSWYRWQDTHLEARTLGTAAYQSGDPQQKAVLTQRAWLAQCYADHFLEDSFSAGHQVNKTLAMQWFVDWIARSRFILVPNHAAVKQVTTTNQPRLWGRQLYERGYSGPANDPQTAEQYPTYERRRDATGVQAYGATTQDQAYQEYLSFLAAAVVQLSSNQIHNYLNNHALWVASYSNPSPLKLWGDGTMLNGVESVATVSQAVHSSQGVIRDILASGQSATSVQMLRDLMPSMVVANPSDPASAVPLADWHDAQLQALCDRIFDQSANWLADVLSRFDPLLGWISVDQSDTTPI